MGTGDHQSMILPTKRTDESSARVRARSRLRAQTSSYEQHSAAPDWLRTRHSYILVSVSPKRGRLHMHCSHKAQHSIVTMGLSAKQCKLPLTKAQSIMSFAISAV